MMMTIYWSWTSILTMKVAIKANLRRIRGHQVEKQSAIHDL